jgi:mRNA interferase MazF
MIYSKGDIVIFPYPFSDLSHRKVRPAIIIGSVERKYQDVFIVPITSRIDSLNDGEFIIKDWKSSGLNVASAVKRGCFLVDIDLIIKKIGILDVGDLVNWGIP